MSWSPVGSALRVRRGYAGDLYEVAGCAPHRLEYQLGTRYLDPTPVSNTVWMARDRCGRVLIKRGTLSEVVGSLCTPCSPHSCGGSCACGGRGSGRCSGRCSGYAGASTCACPASPLRLQSRLRGAGQSVIRSRLGPGMLGQSGRLHGTRRF